MIRKLHFALAAVLTTFCVQSLVAQDRPDFVDDDRPVFVDDDPFELPEFEPRDNRDNTSRVRLLPGEEVDYAGIDVEQINNESYVSASNALILERLESLEMDLYNYKNEALHKELQEKKEQAKKPVYKLGGRIHIDHWAFPSTSDGIGYFENPATGFDPENRWTFRRVRLELSGDNPNDIFWRFQVDFNTAEEGEFKDVYIGYKGLPYNQRIMLGMQKRPYGLDHWNSSRYNVGVERPMVVEAFNSDTRRPGLGVWGHTDDEATFWQYGTYFLRNPKFDGDIVGDNPQLSFNGRIGGSPIYDEEEGNWMHWAIAGMYAVAEEDGVHDNEARFVTRPEARSDRGWVDTGEIAGINHFQILALEHMLNLGPFNVTTEFMQNWVDRGDTFGDVSFHGYYVQASYFITGEAMTYERATGQLDRVHPHRNFGWFERACGCGEEHGWGAWQLAFRYSVLDVSDGDVLGGDATSYTAGLNWWWTPYTRIQFNVIRGFIEDHEPVNGFTSGSYTTIGTRYMIDF